MTSRERVLTAFAHKEPDRVPVDFGGMCTAMVNCQVVAQLRDYYGLPHALPRINDMATMTAYVDPDLGECLGVDVQQLYNYGDIDRMIEIYEKAEQSPPPLLSTEVNVFAPTYD